MDLRDGPETVLREVVSERMRGLCCTSEVGGVMVERSRRESKNHVAQRTRVTTSTLLRFAETQQNQSVAKHYSLASSLMITIPTYLFSLYFFSFRAVRRLFPLLSLRDHAPRDVLLRTRPPAVSVGGVACRAGDQTVLARPQTSCLRLLGPRQQSGNPCDPPS